VSSVGGAVVGGVVVSLVVGASVAIITLIRRDP